jgi:hypothetical protein
MPGLELHFLHFCALSKTLAAEAGSLQAYGFSYQKNFGNFFQNHF